MRLAPGDDRPPWWTRSPAAEAWRWAVIRYALDSTERTVRLCVILLVLCVPTVLLLAMLKP
jgi:myo-inositol catabolism protein IolC